MSIELKDSTVRQLTKAVEELTKAINRMFDDPDEDKQTEERNSDTAEDSPKPKKTMWDLKKES